MHLKYYYSSISTVHRRCWLYVILNAKKKHLGLFLTIDDPPALARHGSKHHTLLGGLLQQSTNELKTKKKKKKTWSTSSPSWDPASILLLRGNQRCVLQRSWSRYGRRVASWRRRPWAVRGSPCSASIWVAAVHDSVGYIVMTCTATEIKNVLSNHDRVSMYSQPFITNE